MVRKSSQDSSRKKQRETHPGALKRSRGLFRKIPGGGMLRTRPGSRGTKVEDPHSEGDFYRTPRGEVQGGF